MNLYFAVLTFINLFVLLTLSVIILNSKKFTKIQKSNFIFLCGLTVILIFVEFFALKIFNGPKKYRILNYILHYIEFTFTPLSSSERKDLTG